MILNSLTITSREKAVLKGIDPKQFPTGVLSAEETLVIVAIGVRNGRLGYGFTGQNGGDKELRIKISAEFEKELQTAMSLLRASTA